MNVISTNLTDFDHLGINDESCIRLFGFIITEHGEDTRLSKVYEVRATQEDRVELVARQLAEYATEYATERGFKIRTSLNLHGDVFVEKIGFSFRRMVEFKIKELLDDDDGVIQVDKTHKPDSDRSTIYKVAKENKLKVVMELHEDVWQIYLSENSTGRPKSTKRVSGTFETVRLWLDSIDYNKPTVPPETFTQDIADSYLRTMFNKVELDIIYRKGRVTKCRVLVKQHKNQWHVTLNSKPLLSTDNYDTSLINLTLMPYGLTIDDAIIIGKFNNLNVL